MSSPTQPRGGTASPRAEWLGIAGDVAASLRAKDWSHHALGPPEAWPQDLQAALQLLLSSYRPALLFWGEGRVVFFNDAFASTLKEGDVETSLALAAAQGSLAIWRRHWPWIESLLSGPSLRAPQASDARGVFAERAAFSHMLVGDPSNRCARGGLLLTLPPGPGADWQAVLKAGQRHQAVLETIDVGFCVIQVNFDGAGQPFDYRFLEVNPAFERLTGIRGATGRSMREIAPDHEQYWFDRYAEVARTGQPMRFEDEARELAVGRWFDVFAFRVDEPERHHVAIFFSDITDRRAAAAAASAALANERRANALIDAISESAPIGLAFVDEELRFRRINARLAEMNGVPAAEHIGRRPDELLPGVKGLPDVLARWREMLVTGEPWLDVEVRGETPAQPGVPRTWSENFFPVRVDGVTVGLGIVVEETTARREAQERLAASEARFRALIELDPIGIALADPDGRVVLANDAFLSMLGYAREELSSLNWLERTAPESIPMDSAQIQALRDGKPPAPFEKEYIRRDGTRVAALVTAQFLPGERERMIAYAVDITDRRAAERAVREGAAQLRRLIDNMAGFVAMLDREGTLLEIGEPALARGGLQREEVIGRKFWECPWWTHDAGLQARVEAGFREALAGKTTREDVIAQTQGGGRLAIDLMLAPVFDEHGAVTHVIPSGVDISERRRIEIALRDNEQRLQETAEALKQADRRKDDFLATLAHELRNPLAPIRNGIQLMRMVASSQPTLERTTKMMERQMHHLVRLVDDLLDISRITRGKVALRREVVLVNEIVSSAMESCESLFEPQGHSLSVSLSAEPLRVQGDPDRLRQVFSNLFSNAAKFTPRGGQVWVTLERSEAHALVKVRDSGVGIPQERLGQIFEMFAQVHERHGNDGLGIGLALVKQLVLLHGGTVHARSEGPGSGSEFVVCLPLVAAEGARNETLAGEAPRDMRAGRKVLIADDNVDAAESLAEVLRVKGHEVRTAAGGRQALQKAQEESPEVLLLDIGMPDMDGLTVARALRESAGGERIRIIALTGWGQQSDRDSARAAGIYEHLVKPVDPLLLLDMLDDNRPGEAWGHQESQNVP